MLHDAAQLLQAYVDGDEAAFVDAMEAEAKQLVDAPFGENLVRSISWVYANRADSYLGSLQFFYGLDALSAYASSCTRDISNQLNVAGMGFETLRVAHAVIKHRTIGHDFALGPLARGFALPLLGLRQSQQRFHKYFRLD